MGVSENAAVVRQAFAAFKEGRSAELSKLISPELVWHSPGKNALSGTYRGHTGLFEYLQKVARVGLPFQVADVTASDEHVIALMRDNFTKSNGDQYSHMGCLVCRLIDEKIVEVWSINNEQSAYDDLLAEHLKQRGGP